MRIIPYSPRYRQDFIDFNTDWIVEHFGSLEQADVDVFNSIEALLSAGAMIFIAVDEQERALACCMARPLEGRRWELCKLGSNRRLPHAGAGSAVFAAAMRYAEDQGADEIFLLYNTVLKPALHNYE